MNVLVNASQAIKSQDCNTLGEILVKTRMEANYVVLEISDNGPGIPEDILSKIFEPFFSKKEIGQGTGLGLSISYEIIVKNHKGKMEVESKVGKGTKFTIKLPLNLEFTNGQ